MGMETWRPAGRNEPSRRQTGTGGGKTSPLRRVWKIANSNCQAPPRCASGSGALDGPPSPWCYTEHPSLKTCFPPQSSSTRRAQPGCFCDAPGEGGLGWCGGEVLGRGGWRGGPCKRHLGPDQHVGVLETECTNKVKRPHSKLDRRWDTLPRGHYLRAREESLTRTALSKPQQCHQIYASGVSLTIGDGKSTAKVRGSCPLMQKYHPRKI